MAFFDQNHIYVPCGFDKVVKTNIQYLIDTHTAVASAVYGKYVSETGDTAKAVIASITIKCSYAFFSTCCWFC